MIFIAHLGLLVADDIILIIIHKSYSLEGIQDTCSILLLVAINCLWPCLAPILSWPHLHNDRKMSCPSRKWSKCLWKMWLHKKQTVVVWCLCLNCTMAHKVITTTHSRRSCITVNDWKHRLYKESIEILYSWKSFYKHFELIGSKIGLLVNDVYIH